MDITNSVAATNAKKDLIVAAGYRQQILDGLNLLVGDHETLSAAIAVKLNPLTLVSLIRCLIVIITMSLEVASGAHSLSKRREFRDLFSYSSIVEITVLTSNYS